MHRWFYSCAILVLGLASPTFAEQPTQMALQAQSGTSMQPPSEDQTFRSVPPAPPPPRRAESPPPFPPMPRTAPKHRKAEVRHHSAQPRKAHPLAERRAKLRAADKSQHHVTLQEKKDERFCKSLSHKQMVRNSKCRTLNEKARSSAQARTRAHQPTKQEMRDERRCSKLSLRDVMRSSACRKVAQQQLDAQRENHRKASRTAKRHPVKHRRR